MKSAVPMKLAVIVPTYNEQDSIAELTSAISVAGRSGGFELKTFIVDDSRDLATIEALRSQIGNALQATHRPQKAGRGSAVLEGVRQGLDWGADFFVEMDADFSHPPGQIPTLVAFAQERSLDLVIASRYTRTSQILNWPLGRRLFSAFANRLAKLLLRVPVSDYTNGFRCYSRRAAERLIVDCGKRGSGFIALSEILVALYYQGFKVGEIPTIFKNRLRGESSLNFSEIKNAARGICLIYQYRKQLLARRK